MKECLLNQKQVEKLIREYSSPLYVFHEEPFIENYHHLIDAFRSIYPNYNIGYSYKTNYTPYICNLVKSLGGYAEVVSDMEYRLAKKLGYDSSKIVYNGPVKGEGLFEHLLNGGVANVDNLDELNSIIEFANIHKDHIIRLAFRCNIDIDQGFISRFGVDAYPDAHQASELDAAYSLIKDCPNIKVVGIHCHVGRSRSLEAWQKRIEVMFKLVDAYFEEPPEFIDLGSGMNSVMEDSLACQFGGHIPTYEEYAEVVAKAMLKKYGHLPLDKQPTLFTEPGTTLISGYVSFLSTVLSIKNVKGKTYVTFDGSGGNMGDICHLKQLPITVYRFGQNAQSVCDADFVGYTCLEHDAMYKGYNGELSVKDVVQFRNVGSYSNVFKPPFIYPNCAMVALDKEGKATLIKRKETFEDVFSTYVL